MELGPGLFRREYRQCNPDIANESGFRRAAYHLNDFEEANEESLCPATEPFGLGAALLSRSQQSERGLEPRSGAREKHACES